MKAEKDIDGAGVKSVPDLATILSDQGKAARRPRRRIWLTILVLVLAGAAAAYLMLGGEGQAYSYTTQPVRRGDLSVVVVATGSVQPTEQVDISSELSGTVRAVNVTYNSVVTAGEVLAELDTNKLQADIENARAQLTSARANVLKAETEVASAKTAYDRLTSLVGQRISSQQDLDAARFTHEAAIASKAVSEAAVLSAEASLRLAEVNMSKSRIISPIDGVVLTRDVDPGQTVASSLSAPILFTIAGDLRRMELQVAVDEADVGQVSENQEATFSVDAYPDKSFPARIETVRFASETVSNVVTYKAILTVDNADLLLRPGMTATADIVVQSVEDALLVPNAALRYSHPEASGQSSGNIMTRIFRAPRMGGRRTAGGREDRGARSVWVLRNGVPERVSIDAGPSDGQSTVLRSGEIREDDLLITAATPRNR